MLCRILNQSEIISLIVSVNIEYAMKQRKNLSKRFPDAPKVNKNSFKLFFVG